MKQTLYGTTALATVGLLMAALAGCAAPPAPDPNKPEEPIKLELGGYLNGSFAIDEASDED